MTKRKNTTGAVLVYRDDAGKHHVKPGETFEVAGGQPMPMVDALILSGAPVPADDPAPTGEAGAARARPRKVGP